MNKQTLMKLATDFVENSEYNYVSKEIAISEKVVGMKMYEAPILGIASSDDAYFAKLKEPNIIGEHFMLPNEWQPNAKSVISIFLPFNEAVKKGNVKEKVWPSEEWLHARIEGQILINKLCMYLKSELENAGNYSVAPSIDERFWNKTGFDHSSLHPEASYTSNWSERHAAFVCGLGTFGLSKGLITKKGMAGRLGSIITALALTADTREYETFNQYCSMCGACIKQCPVHAISFEHGKNHSICSAFLDKTTERFKPRYGCGKCQVGVPCENGIPIKAL